MTNSTVNPNPSSAGSLKPVTVTSGSLFSLKTSLRTASRMYMAEGRRRLKSCNCIPESERKYIRDSCFKCQQSNIDDNDFSSEEDDSPSIIVPELTTPNSTNQMRYSLIKSKQMVGIFVTIWVKRELVQHIGHLRTSCISRGIMGCLGNKVCFYHFSIYKRIELLITFTKLSLCSLLRFRGVSRWVCLSYRRAFVSSVVIWLQAKKKGMNLEEIQML